MQQTTKFCITFTILVVFLSFPSQGQLLKCRDRKRVKAAIENEQLLQTTTEINGESLNTTTEINEESLGTTIENEEAIKTTTENGEPLKTATETSRQSPKTSTVNGKSHKKATENGESVKTTTENGESVKTTTENGESVKTTTEAGKEKPTNHQPEDKLEVSKNEGFQANELTDSLINEVHREIDKRGIDRLPLPDFEETFRSKFAGLPITGSFRGQNGLVESLKTLERKGDATAYLNDTTFYLNSTLGLKTLKIRLNYHARLSFLRSSGEVTAIVRSNSISFLGGLDNSSGKCRLVLKSLKVDELGKIDLDLSGLGGFLKDLRSKVATWITNRCNSQIRKLVEVKLENIIQQELSQADCPDLGIL